MTRTQRPGECPRLRDVVLHDGSTPELEELTAVDEQTRRQITWVIIIGAIMCVVLTASYRRAEIDRLTGLIADGTSQQRIEAVRILVAKQKLQEALEDQPRWVQDNAIAAIPLIGTHDAYYEMLTCHAMLDAPVQGRDQTALTLLQRRGVEIFIEAIQDKDATTRGTAKSPLTNIGLAIEEDEDAEDNPVIDACMDLIDAWDGYVRDMVRDVLAGIHTETVTDRLIPVMQLAEPDQKILPDGKIRDRTTQEFMRAKATAEATLVAMKIPAIQPIIDDLLTFKDADVRGNACRVLGTIANQTNKNILPADAVAVVEPLLDRLNNDKHWAVQRRAATALGLLSTVATDNGVVQPLISHLSGQDEVKAASVEALGRIGDLNAVEPLVNTLLGNRRGATRELRIALTALGAIRDEDENVSDEEVIPSIGRALGSAEPEVRLIATQAIAQIGGDHAVVPLGTMLQDENLAIRRVSSDALRAIADERVLVQVSAALNDSDWQVYHAARDALASVGPPAIPVLIAALGSENPRVASMAQQALLRIGTEDAAPALRALQAALSDPSSGRAHWAAIAMGDIGYSAVDYAVAVLENRSSPVSARAQAALALGRTNAGEAVKPLAEALRKQEPPVKIEAVKALSRLADERATPALVAALKSKSPQVRDVAMDVLSDWRLGDVRKQLKKLSDTGDEDSRRRATIVLAELTSIAAHQLLDQVAQVGEASAHQETVNVATLQEAALDAGESDKVRLRAIRALGYAGEQATLSTLIKLLKPGSKYAAYAGPAALATARIGRRFAAKKEPGSRVEMGEAAKTLIDLMLATKDDDLRAKAAAGLSLMGDQPVWTLIEQLETVDDELKLWIIATLGAIGKPATNPVLETRGNSKDIQRRVWVVSALPLIGDQQAMELVKNLPEEERPDEAGKVEPAKALLARIRTAAAQ